MQHSNIQPNEVFLEFPNSVYESLAFPVYYITALEMASFFFRQENVITKNPVKSYCFNWEPQKSNVIKTEKNEWLMSRFCVKNRPKNVKE